MAPTIIQQSQPAAARQGWRIAVATLATAITVWFLFSLSSAVPSAGTARTKVAAEDAVLDTLMAEAPAWASRAEIAPPTAEQRAEAAARRAAVKPARGYHNLTGAGTTTPASGAAVLDGDPETYWTGHRLVVTFSPAVETGEVVVNLFGPVQKTVRVNGDSFAVNPEDKTALKVEGGTLQTVEVTVEGVTVVPNGVRDLLVY